MRARLVLLDNTRTPLTDTHHLIETESSIAFLFLALIIFPQVQKRAQEELDIVVGKDRLPTFDDRPRLPYIDAICRELLRWQMVTPIGSIIPYYRSIYANLEVKYVTFRSSSRVK